MDFFKKLKAVIAIVLIILVLILIRTTGRNHFKNDAKKWAEGSVKKSNELTADQERSLPGHHLLIYLDKNVKDTTLVSGDKRIIPADSILESRNIHMIMNFDGPVVLFSSDPGLSARIWMILSQLGCKNLYVLSKDPDNEVLKYKFQRDTLSGIK